MALEQTWAGRAQGTSTGNLFARFQQDERGAIKGYLRLNDDRDGLSAYEVVGTFDGQKIQLEGTPTPVPDGYAGQKLRAKGVLNTKGELEGDWQTDVGGEGRFYLFPHRQIGQDDLPNAPVVSVPDQFHTARLELGPVGIDRDGIIQIAEFIQKDFRTPVVISITGETTQNFFLDGFKKRAFNEERATIVWIRGTDPEAPGLNRVVSVEFGPQTNFAFAQSTDEAWARGKRDILRQLLRPFERNYATTAKRFSPGLNTLLFGGLLVFLPSLEELWQRVVLVIGFIGITQSMAFLDRKILQHASIHLTQKKRDALSRFGPSIASWGSGIIATVLGALLVAWLQGTLNIGEK